MRTREEPGSGHAPGTSVRHTPRVAEGGAQHPRDAILDTAVILASEKGLEAVSLSRLASATNMSKSGLYAHLSSKEKLQLATVERAWEVFERAVLGDGGGEAMGGLEALLERWLAFYERRVLPGGCLFLSEGVHFALRPGPVREALASRVTQQTEALEKAAQHANATGALPGEKDASQVAFELHSLLLNADALYSMAGNRAVFEQSRARFREILGAAVS